MSHFVLILINVVGNDLLINIIQGEVSWRKPKLMKNSDIPVKDEWIVLRDAQDFPYYYNPYSMEMSWSPPKCKQQMLCSNPCVLYTWWKQYPTPQGPCEYFADHTDCETGRLFCKRCWKIHHQC